MTPKNTANRTVIIAAIDRTPASDPALGTAAALAQGVGGSEDIGRDDLVEQTCELRIIETDSVESLKFFAEVLLQHRAVAYVWSIVVFEVAQLRD